LILLAVLAAKYSLRASGLQRAPSAELIFHMLKFGSSQAQHEHAYLDVNPIYLFRRESPPF